MAGWAGFSDADLKQMKHSSSPGPPRQSVNNATKQAMVARKQKAQQQRDMARQRALDFAQGSSSSAPLPSSQRLSSPSPAPPPSKEEVKGQSEVGDKTTPGESLVANASHNVEDDATKKSVEVDDGEGGESTAGVKEMDEEEGLRVELSRVEQFRLQQEKMEAENKQRRRILANAIQQRSKMAKEEAEKLTKVQKELKHLDSLVNADVSIIRDKIEVASMDFLQAQKRYERTEKEFVEAKMELAEKSDLKESLTEHLYTVIQQNETRKAQHLAHLMKELGLGSDHCPLPPALPPLLSSFSSINTLHHRPPHTTPPSTPTSSPGEAPLTPCPDPPPEEGGGETPEGQPQEHGSSNKEDSQVAEGGGKITDKSHIGANESDKCANLKAGEVSVVQGESGGDGKSEGEEKKGGDEKGTEKSCVENGSPECQDGGASTVP